MIDGESSKAELLQSRKQGLEKYDILFKYFPRLEKYGKNICISDIS